MAYVISVLFPPVLHSDHDWKATKWITSAGLAHTRKKIDIEQKIKMLNKYEGGQSLSAIPHELDLATSTVKVFSMIVHA
jgi:hypothetical protein